jgi:hypothetical protein
MTINAGPGRINIAAPIRMTLLPTKRMINFFAVERSIGGLEDQIEKSSTILPPPA